MIVSSSQLLREVPEALIRSVQSGESVIFGSTIKSVATGRFVGHLQETGGMTSLVSAVGMAVVAPSPMSVANVGMSVAKTAVGVVKLVQNEQIKGAIARLGTAMDTLEALGVANLALGAAGIGVSVAGFAIMSKRIDGVRREVTAVADRVDAVLQEVRDLRRESIAERMDELHAQARAMDEAWNLSDAAAERRWQDVARASSELSVRFARYSGELLAKGPSFYAAADPLLDGLALSNALHVTTLAAAGETSAAIEAARDAARRLGELTGDIELADVAIDKLRGWDVAPGTPEWSSALETATQASRGEAQRYREREAAAATRAAPLKKLAATGVKARDWFAAAHEHQASPLLIMLEE